jgi:hypothetical protein
VSEVDEQDAPQSSSRQRNIPQVQPSGAANQETQDVIEALLPTPDYDELRDCSADLYKQLLGFEDSRVWLRHYRAAREGFEAARLQLGQSEELFITPDLLGESGAGPVDDMPESARMTVACANLVSLMRLVLDIKKNHGEADEDEGAILNELDSPSFPNIFEGFQAEGRRPTDDEFDLALRIRQCCLAGEVAARPTNNALEQAASLFCKSVSKGASGSKLNATDRLLKGPYLPIAGIDPHAMRNFKKEMQALVEQLSQAKNRDHLIQALRTKVPQRKLWEDLESWSRQMYEKLVHHANEDADQDSEPALASDEHPSEGTIVRRTNAAE